MQTLLFTPVGSYPTFSLSPSRFGGMATLSLWHSLLSCILCRIPAFSCGGLPYVARTFLREFNLAAIEQPALKFTNFLANG